MIEDIAKPVSASPKTVWRTHIVRITRDMGLSLFVTRFLLMSLVHPNRISSTWALSCRSLSQNGTALKPSAGENVKAAAPGPKERGPGARQPPHDEREGPAAKAVMESGGTANASPAARHRPGTRE